jgi:beta-lactamase class A
MKKYACLFFVFLACGKQKDDERLMNDVSEIFASAKGTFAVAYKNLTTGESLLINEHDIFHAASTMKTPVMVEVFKQVSEGKFSLDDSLVLKNDFKSIVDGSPFALDSASDSEKNLYEHIGEKRSIDSLVYDMIIVSSNLATNMIIELVDAKNVTTTLRDLGANDMRVLRGVEDGKAYEKGMNNVTSAFDLMLLFEKIAKRELVTPEASERMERILLDQKFNEIIPAYLPKNVRVAHKTGSITGVQHDSGIVVLPNGQKYVLVLLSKDLVDEKAGIEAMAKASERIYEHTVMSE